MLHFNLIYLIFTSLLHYPNFTTFQQWTRASWGVVDIRQTSWSYRTHHPWAIFFIWDHSYITSAKGQGGWVQKISVFADIQYCIYYGGRGTRYNIIAALDWKPRLQIDLYLWFSDWKLVFGWSADLQKKHNFLLPKDH